jgi:hypothetical protein
LLTFVELDNHHVQWTVMLKRRKNYYLQTKSKPFSYPSIHEPIQVLVLIKMKHEEEKFDKLYHNYLYLLKLFFENLFTFFNVRIVNCSGIMVMIHFFEYF